MSAGTLCSSGPGCAASGMKGVRGRGLGSGEVTHPWWGKCLGLGASWHVVPAQDILLISVPFALKIFNPKGIKSSNTKHTHKKTNTIKTNINKN